MKRLFLLLLGIHLIVCMSCTKQSVQTILLDTYYNHEINPENVYPLQGVIAGTDKMYMRGTCAIACDEHATPLVWTLDNDVIMAEAPYGQGFVIAIADPWIYNEYIGHLLLPDNYDNANPARWLVKHLLTGEK